MCAGTMHGDRRRYTRQDVELAVVLAANRAVTREPVKSSEGTLLIAADADNAARLALAEFDAMRPELPTVTVNGETFPLAKVDFGVTV